MDTQHIGLGSINAPLYFYIKNRPPLEHYQHLSSIKLMKANEIAHIATETGNHWRKIFNVYAKLMFELAPEPFNRWQTLRDQALLQNNKHCLLFSTPNINKQSKNKIHIVLGKGYAQELGLLEECIWLNESFAVNLQKRIIICPYFDYRQLSNIKITQLCRLIEQLLTERTEF